MNGAQETITWFTASASQGGAQCVEVGMGGADGGVLVRDTKDREGSVQHYTRGEWLAFLDGAKKGEFDLLG